MHVGACFALRDSIVPLKVETECLTKKQLKTYTCPETVPHKCKFHWLRSEATEEMEETEEMPRNRCPSWVGNDTLSGLCNITSHVGACYAPRESNASSPSKVGAECLTMAQYES